MSNNETRRGTRPGNGNAHPEAPVGGRTTHLLGDRPLLTMPLSFIAGIVVSLLAPEPSAASGYAAVERRMHLGGEQ